MEFSLNVFSSLIFAPALIILGSFGNLVGTVISTKKQLINLGPQSVYICMFIFDCLNFPLIIQPYLAYQFNTDITITSSWACKTYWYVSYALATVSPMMNVYISIERYISITYQSYKLFLRKKTVQITYMLTIILFNLLIYIPIAFYFDEIDENETNNTISYMTCDFVDHNSQKLLGYMDLVNRVFIPSTLTILFSVLIVITIFSSRSRVSRNIQDNRMFRNDVRFAVTSILLNGVYIVFSLPVSILVLLPNYTLYELYIFFTFLFFGAYSGNFYCMLTSNRLYRAEFFKLFKSKQRKNRIIGNNKDFQKRATHTASKANH